MDLRITPETVSDQLIYNLRKNSDTLGNLQEQAATGKRLLLPEDTVTVLANNAQDLRLDAYLTNIGSARDTLNTSVSTLQSVSNLLSQARSVTIQGADSSNDANTNNTLAQQIDNIYNQLLDAANTQNTGRYIFSRTATATRPFTALSNGTIVYNGAEQAGSAPVGQGQTVDTYYAGDQAFQQRQRGVTLYSGNTGAAAGTGTDSGTGLGTLLVTHTSTTYQAGSGVTAGTSSAAGDTIIGPAGSHKLTINDTSGTGASGFVSLDGGPPVAFTNSNTNLKVTSTGGDVVYVNTTATTGGFNGTVDITATGTLSVDNGATQTAINFTGNQIVTDGATGAVTNVDSTNIRRAGTAQLNYQSSYDVFQILDAIRNDLRNPTLADGQRAQSLSGRLAELDRVRTGVRTVVGEQSNTLANLDSLESRAQDVQLELRKLTSNLQDADITKVIVDLQSQQNVLQLTLLAAARTNNLSLADFLR
jgi:flagellar hook-associated protein 3